MNGFIAAVICDFTFWSSIKISFEHFRDLNGAEISNNWTFVGELCYGHDFIDKAPILTTDKTPHKNIAAKLQLCRVVIQFVYKNEKCT